MTDKEKIAELEQTISNMRRKHADEIEVLRNKVKELLAIVKK